MCTAAGLTTDPADNPNNLCPEGYVCPPGTTSLTAKSNPCPAGYFCGFGTTPATKFDNLCRAGLFCPPATTFSAMLANVCPVGYFCLAGTPDNPAFLADQYRCPTQTTSLPGATSMAGCTRNCGGATKRVCQAVAAVNALGAGVNVTLDTLQSLHVRFDLSHLAYDPSTADMRYLEHFLIAIRPSADARLAMPSWFSSENITLGEPFTVRVTAARPLTVTVGVEITHGLYVDRISFFENRTTWWLTAPSRAYLKDTSSSYMFFSLLRQSSMLDQNIPLPLNAIRDNEMEAFVDVTANASESGNISMSALRDRYAAVAQSDSYWTDSAAAGRDNDVLAFPFLPFFSACKGTDSHVLLHEIVEDPAFCPQLPDISQIKPVLPFDWGAAAFSDECLARLQCSFEEQLTLSARPRWFELLNGAELFYFSQIPQASLNFAFDYTHITAAFGGEATVPVTVLSSKPTSSSLMVPQRVELQLGYYQVSKEEKRLETAVLNMSQFVELPLLDGDAPVSESLNRYACLCLLD